MALEGTIKDFALPDIFQLIGIQRKTGVLTLERKKETVTIKFLEGQVVEADTASDSLENRLGTVLVRTGRIQQKQLDEALQIQRNTLQRLGHILVKREFISQDVLVDALQIQSSQIIYRLFRWREGSYHFDPVEKLDYDHNHSTPMSSENILMEGARMVDEWPIIERRIPSDRIVLRKTAAAEELVGEADGEETAPESEFDLGVDLDLPFGVDDPAPAEPAATPASPPAARSIELSPDERLALSIVDGKRSVREVVDLLTLAEFETFRILADMVNRKLVERVEVDPRAGRQGSGHHWLMQSAGWIAKAAILVAAVAGTLSLPTSPTAPWNLVRSRPTTERLRSYAAVARLERIENSVQVFFLDLGTFPMNLATLVQYGYLDPSTITDPWGRPYRLQISRGGYQILGMDAEGKVRPDLSVSRGFSDLQRLLIESEVELHASTD